LNRLGRT